MITISLQNAGGELDSRKVESPVEAVDALIEMVMAAGEIYGGDKIIVTDDGEEG